MTEVPEHLLRRSAERRAQLGGEPPPADSGGGDAGGGGGAVEAASGAAPAAASAGAAPARAAAPSPPVFTGPPQLPPRKQRVPTWAMPVIVALPLWAFLYAGAFGERTVALPGPPELGRSVYTACAGCHGATGGGVSGPALTGALETFPDFQSHVDWVKSGSAPFAGREYAPGKIASGNMPSFEGELSEEEIIGVVCYERIEFGNADPIPEECLENAAEDGGGGTEASG